MKLKLGQNVLGHIKSNFKGEATLQLSLTSRSQLVVTDFVIRVKCIIFWHIIGLRVYLKCYATDF